MTILFGVTVVFYGLAVALHLGHLVRASDRLLPWARGTLAAAFFVHLLELGARGVAGLHPVGSIHETLGFLSWVVVGALLIAERLRRRLDAVAAFVAPAALVLLLAARLGPDSDGPGAVLGVVGRVHIVLASLGLAVFALAAASSVLYVIEDRQLKRKKFGALVQKGTALEDLDGLAHRCVQLGFPIFTVAMVAGALWSARLGAGLRPEYVIAVVAWIAFAAVLIARLTAGWRGRRAAVLTLVGFSSALMVLGTYLVRAVG